MSFTILSFNLISESAKLNTLWSSLEVAAPPAPLSPKPPSTTQYHPAHPRCPPPIPQDKVALDMQETLSHQDENSARSNCLRKTPLKLREDEHLTCLLSFCQSLYLINARFWNVLLLLEVNTHENWGLG